MKKKVLLIVAFICALVLSLGAFTACGEGMTIELTDTSIDLVVGKSVSLTATATDGSIIEWSSSDETVATVNNRGKVTGVSVGTAVITAAVGEIKATCTVNVKAAITFVFKDAEGNELTEIEVDRNGEPVQITATASDGGEITVWASGDNTIATVENGLVTGLKEGETTLTVRTALGSATIPLKVVDTAEHEAIVEGVANAAAGKWWYYASKADNRSPEITTAEYRLGEAVFEFGGNVNWAAGDVQLGMKKDASAKTGWAAVSGKITSTVAGTVTVFDTVIEITQGTTEFEVYYNQLDRENAFYMSPNADITGGKLIVSDLAWKDFTRVNLETPSFALSGNTITITDTVNAAKGVKQYSIGFFKDANAETPAYAQYFRKAGGDIDPVSIEENGTYILKIKADGISGYVDSAWSTGTDITYTVNNEDVSYELERTTNPTNSRWAYYNVNEDYASVSKATFDKGVVTYEAPELGWKFDSTQMFKKYPQFAEGATIKLEMKVNVNTNGKILISGNLVTLTEGDNEFTVFVTQPANGMTITILFGDSAAINDEVWTTHQNVAFKIEVVKIGEVVPEKLKAPAATYTAATEEAAAKIEVTDAENEAANVSGYQLGFFNAEGELVGRAAIGENGAFSDLAIKDGTYTLKVRAVPKTLEYEYSDWSAAITTEYTVKNGGVTADVPFGGDVDNPNAKSDTNKWYYWNDQGWVGANTAVEQAKYNDGTKTVTITYKVTGGAHEAGVRLFYKNTELTEGTTYALSMKINVAEAVEIKLNGVVFNLVKGDNNITVYYDEAAGGYSVEFWVRVDAEGVINNTITVSDVAWTAYTYKDLAAPTVAIAEDGTVTVTDSNAAGVASYTVGFFKNDELAATVTVENGKKIDVSRVEGGEYTAKIKAVALNGYKDSAWSEGIAYTVVNEGGVQYDLATDWNAGVENQHAGTWGAWADQDWCGSTVTVTSAQYDNGKIIITFTSTGTCNFGLQIKFVNANYVAGQKYTFDVVATSDMDIQVEDGAAAATHLTAGQSQHLTGGADASFYIQVNIKDGVSGTITVSNVVWAAAE